MAEEVALELDYTDDMDTTEQGIYSITIDTSSLLNHVQFTAFFILYSYTFIQRLIQII